MVGCVFWKLSERKLWLNVREREDVVLLLCGEHLIVRAILGQNSGDNFNFDCVAKIADRPQPLGKAPQGSFFKFFPIGSLLQRDDTSAES